MNIKKRGIVLLLFLGALFLAEAVSHAAATGRLALLIGNSRYEHGGMLANPVHDVQSMADALKKLGFSVTIFENCSQKEMKTAIDRFGRQLKDHAVGLFFFAGHGVQVKGTNYLIPVEADLKNEKQVEYDCVRADRVLAMMEGAGDRTNIVILDACRNNPFERSWQRSQQGAGLAFMNAPSGSLIAYATAPGQIARDGQGDVHSPYTAALLEHIDTPGISVLQMFQRVRATVKERSQDAQTPWESTSLLGDFYFVSEEGAATVSRQDPGGRQNTGMEEGEKKEEKKPNTQKGRLFVDTEPAKARVRILNIRPTFRQGIVLPPGSYEVEVSHEGFETHKEWTRVPAGASRRLTVHLSPRTVSKPEPAAEARRTDTYRDILRLRVEARKRYPLSAWKARITGRVTVGFAVDGRGRVSGLRLIQGSGNPDLDQAALAAVRAAAPFPSPPGNPRSPLQMELTLAWGVGSRE